MNAPFGPVASARPQGRALRDRSIIGRSRKDAGFGYKDSLAKGGSVARNSMVNEKLLGADSPRGVWEITDKGRAFLERSG